MKDPNLELQLSTNEVETVKYISNSVFKKKLSYFNKSNNIQYYY